MRTMVNDTATVACSVRFKVEDSAGSWHDLTDRVYSISYSDELESDSCSIKVSLRNAYNKFVNVTPNISLDPFDSNSTLNQVSGSYDPLLARYHACTLEISKDDGVHWYLVFSGYIGPGSVHAGVDVSGDDVIEVSPVDLTMPYKEDFWYDPLIYKDADATSIILQVFTDRGFDQNVNVINNPNFHVEEIKFGETNLWEAQKKLIEPTGYIYRMKWDESSGSFKPSVYDPLRDSATPVATFNGNFRHRDMDVDESGVRTKVIVRYRNRYSGSIGTAQAEDDAARLKYGLPDGKGGRKHKVMWYSVQGINGRYSMIDTPDEAQTLADNMLYDLKEPSPNVEIQLPYVDPAIEVHDLLAFVGRDYTVNVGVTSISWNLDINNKVGTTNIRGTADRVIGQYHLWLARDSRSDQVKQENQMSLMQGDGLRPPRPETPTCRSYYGSDTDGENNPVLVCEVSDVDVWDLANYHWELSIEGENQPRYEVTEKPRLVVKGLPKGKKVRVRVQARDWSSVGG